MTGSTTSLRWCLTAIMDGLNSVEIPATFKKFVDDDIRIHTFDATAFRSLSGHKFISGATGEATSITDQYFKGMNHTFSLSADQIPYTWVILERRFFGDAVKKGSVTAYVGTSGGEINYALYDDSLGNMFDPSSNKVGNIFYNNGLIVINNTLLGDQIIDWANVSFRSTVQITEHEYTIRIGKDEFNHSMNPSAFADLAGNYVPNYAFPFLTSIGLYNRNGEMLMIGKLAQPLRISANLDTTLKIRFDL